MKKDVGLRMIGRAGLLAGLVLAATMAGGGAAAANGAIARGRTLYSTDCAICHQASGAGGIRFGHAVSADLRAPGLETTYRHDDKLIVRAILMARNESDRPLDMPMPAWRGRLSAAQAKDIVAYLHTLRASS